MINDKATEKIKDRLRDAGLIINAGAAKPKPKRESKSKKSRK